MLSFTSHTIIIIETSINRCEFPECRQASSLEKEGTSLHNSLAPLTLRTGNVGINLGKLN